MKSASAIVALSVALLPLFSNALPAMTRDQISDTDVLNFALTLEHLEAAFYVQSLNILSEQDFLDAGLDPSIHGRYLQISEHEQTHVKFLEDALGSAAVKPCEYNFGITDVKSFVDTSDMLETIGTSAYTGAAKLLSNPDFLTVAGSILSTEARQSAFISSFVRKSFPVSNSFETPLDLNQVFTLASGLIKSCPSSNEGLVKATAFPPLVVSGAEPGKTLVTKYIPSDKPLFAAFLQGLTPTVVPIAHDGSFTVPGHLVGVSYLLITSDANKVEDSVTIAGPAFLNFGLDANGAPAAPAF